MPRKADDLKFQSILEICLFGKILCCYDFPISVTHEPGFSPVGEKFKASENSEKNTFRIQCHYIECLSKGRIFHNNQYIQS